MPERRLPRSVTLTSVSKKFASTLLELALLVLTLGVGWCLWALMVSWKGQTPARHVLGTRVVSARDGRPLGIGGMIFDRGIFGSLVQLLSIVLTLSFTAFIPIWDDRNQTVCDKMSGSIVVNDRDQLLVVP